MERRFLCKQCLNVFDHTVPDSPSPSEEIKCPACCGVDVAETPPWVPLDSGTNIFEAKTWEYECQQCKHKFKMPIPKSPTEDKNRRCPVCNSAHLHLLTGKENLPLYCG